jgi:hypothetical protein
MIDVVVSALISHVRTTRSHPMPRVRVWQAAAVLFKRLHGLSVTAVGTKNKGKIVLVLL